MLIVIDGIDGSGKTTQTNLLVKRLKQQGYKACSFDFPQYDQNFFGHIVGQYLHGQFGSTQKISPYLSSILYAADRWETKQKIEHKLNQGYIVVLNRYVPSSKIHQASKLKTACAQNKYLKWLDKLEYEIFKIPKPDLVLFLHLPIDIVCDLINKRGRQKDEHERDVRHLSEALAMAQKLAGIYKHWYRVDCSNNQQILSRKDISEKIWQIIKKKLI